MKLDSVQFGISDFCSSRCIMCHQTKEYFSSRECRFMSAALFRKFLREALEENLEFTTLYLFWLGEPLLHPEIDRMLAMLPEFNEGGRIFRSLFINTSARDLDRERTMHLLDTCYALAPYCTSRVIFSLDAATVQTYSRIRRGGDGARVMENVEMFVRERQARGLIFPETVFQMVVMEENLHEIDLFIARWRTFMESFGITLKVTGSREDFNGDSIYLRPLLFDETWRDNQEMKERHRALINKWMDSVIKYSGSPQVKKEELLRTLEKESAHPARDARSCSGRISVCRAIFASPVVATDGSVTTCCRDFFLKNSLGNLADSSLSQLWKGEKARMMRRGFLDSLVPGKEVAGKIYDMETVRKGWPEFCRSCYMPDENWFSDEKALENFLANCGEALV